MSPIPSVKMNNGAEMPVVAMGLWTGTPGADQTAQQVDVAIKAGYRHFDTAAMYANEKETGECLRKSGVPRQELFVTTKVWNDRHRDVEAAFDESFEKLGLEYIDLYLMHWPQAQKADGSADDSISFVDTWKQLERLLETRAGKVRAIGVSNFSSKTLKELLEHAKVVPACNQIETHPYAPDHELVDLCKSRGIVVTAYTPLGLGKPAMLEDADIVAVAKELNALPSQVVLSWNVQRGVPVLPKTQHEDRAKKNIELVHLSDEQMNRISKIHEDPKRRGYLNTVVYNASDNSVLGWSLEKLGWPYPFYGY